MLMRGTRIRMYSSPKISRFYYYLAGLLAITALAIGPFIFYDNSPGLQQRAMQAVSGLFSLSPSFPRSSFGSKKSKTLRVKSQYSPTAVPITSPGSMSAKWAQRTVVIPPQRRGCHLITPKVLPHCLCFRFN
jgi:hypothetical protein